MIGKWGHILLGIIVSCAIVSCGGHSDRASLVALDSLILQNPDSACELLATYPAFMLYARELQNARPANNKLNVFDLLALFRASQGESQRHTDEVTLRKLIGEGSLISTQDGYKLSNRYYEIVKNVGTVDNDRKDDTVNVPVNDTVKLSQLAERQKKIYRIIKDGTINDTANDTVNDAVTAKTLSESLGTSIITIKRDIAAMQSAGFIKRVGSDKIMNVEI